MPSATALVRDALAGSGVEVVASCPADVYDARAPESFRSGALLPGARGVIVAGSAGPALWRRLRAHEDDQVAPWSGAHPLDDFVAGLLDRADRALAAAGLAFRRFEPTLRASVRLDFVAMAEIVGLGARGPFALLIHPEHGPWWALRGAWLVDAEVDPPLRAEPPCRSCSAPCVGGWERAHGRVERATPEVRGRCVVGQPSRYDDDQIAYHYDRAAAVVRLRAEAARRGGARGGRGGSG